MTATPDNDLGRYWAGLSLLDRLAQEGAELSSEDVCAMLGTRSVKGIGAALSGTRQTLRAAGIRMVEAVVRRAVRGRSIWVAGPRVRQAMHVLEQERYRWTGGWRDDSATENVRPGETGPVLVLRALKCRGDVYRVDGGMAELDQILDDERFEIDDARSETVGEVFVARIEPGEDGRVRPLPDGYGGKRQLGARRIRLRRTPGAGCDGYGTTAHDDRLGRRSDLAGTSACFRGRAAAGRDGARGNGR